MRLAMPILLALLAASPALPQCAMCREAASSQQQKAIDGLNTGIAVLAVPPFAVAAGIGILAWRRRGG